jgi:[ribosomal protein S18]-alanine N-acetyltransferase
MAELREYLPADFKQLLALDQQCFPKEIAYSAAELGYYLRSPGAICLLAMEQEKTIGFILGDRTRQSAGHVVTLDVMEASRKSGIGSTLMFALEERFRAADCTSAVLEVAVNNDAALRFYKKHGYSVLKTLRRYYPGGVDGLLMGKSLIGSQSKD